MSRQKLHFLEAYYSSAHMACMCAIYSGISKNERSVIKFFRGIVLGNFQKR